MSERKNSPLIKSLASNFLLDNEIFLHQEEENLTINTPKKLETNTNTKR
jgi:hypothetical protein